jgi:hypothetical protein
MTTKKPNTRLVNTTHIMSKIMTHEEITIHVNPDVLMDNTENTTREDTLNKEGIMKEAT